jgi:tetratricopeptide (TPR) repeat protein
MAKDWNKEIENYKKDTDADPTDSNAWYNFGMANIQSVGAKLQSGNLDAECKQKVPVAESALKKAIELYPQHGRAHVLLGQLYRYTKQYDDAIKYSKKGLELPPDTNDWFAAAETVASCYMLKEDMPHSIEFLELIKEHYPNDPMTIFKRACCYWQAGNLDGAEEEFEHLTKIPGANPNAPSCLQQVRAAQAKRSGTPKAVTSEPVKVDEPAEKIEVAPKVQARPRPSKKDEDASKTQAKAQTKADETTKKVQDSQAKAQELGKKLTDDIKKVMASDMPPDKKGAEVTRLQKEFNDNLTSLMKK